MGDLIFQPILQNQIDSGLRSYRSFWRGVEGAFAGADVIYGNIEGPVAGNWPRRTSLGRLNFSYAPALIDDLLAAGFDIISTANNHALDRGPRGVDRTIDALQQRGLAFVGTRKSTDPSGHLGTVLRVRGINIGWIACTYGTNGFPDRHRQVQSCFDASSSVLTEIHRLAHDPTIAAVIFTPHWGIEDTTMLDPDQSALAEAAIEAGALAVIGTHPHVIQAWEKRTSAGGDRIVIYSTGNFVSGQPAAEQRRGMVVRLELVKPAEVTAARLSKVMYVLTEFSEPPHYAVREWFGRPPEGLPVGNRVSVAGLESAGSPCPELKKF